MWLSHDAWAFFFSSALIWDSLWPYRSLDILVHAFMHSPGERNVAPLCCLLCSSFAQVASMSIPFRILRRISTAGGNVILSRGLPSLEFLRKGSIADLISISLFFLVAVVNFPTGREPVWHSQKPLVLDFQAMHRKNFFSSPSYLLSFLDILPLASFYPRVGVCTHISSLCRNREFQWSLRV